MDCFNSISIHLNGRNGDAICSVAPFLINEWLIVRTDDASTLSEVSEEARSRHLVSINLGLQRKMQL